MNSRINKDSISSGFQGSSSKFGVMMKIGERHESEWFDNDYQLQANERKMDYELSES